MIWPFPRRSRSVLGVDIGTSTIRVVEVSRRGEQKKLENYGFVSLAPYYERPVRRIRRDTILLSSKEIAEILKAIIKEARFRSQRVVLSIPDFTSFFTTFSLPPMSREELSQAVHFEARRHVPLPLSEVTLDWFVTKGVVSDKKKERLEILLVAVHNEAVNQYRRIIEFCDLELLALEAEVFGLQRALVKDRDAQGVVALIDIGAQSTTCSVVDKSILKLSHSFDVTGNDFTERLAKGLDLEYGVAEELKKKQGILAGEKNTADILTPLFDFMFIEVKKVVESFYLQEGKDVQTYIISGGSAIMPGLGDYLSTSLGKEVKIGQPFADMVYPAILEKTLKQIGPEFSVAVGMALKGLEF